jgi:phytoene dehydrogenase-like protein
MLRVAVVGSGPNGLTAAARLAAVGHRVVVFEGQEDPGGSARSMPLLGEGSVVDVGAAAHPFGIRSPAFEQLKLEHWGIEWVHPDCPLAHPFEDGEAALLRGSLSQTSEALGVDSGMWGRVHRGVYHRIDNVLADVLTPMMRTPRHPLSLFQLGKFGFLSASFLARRLFKTDEARALFAGSALHSMLPLDSPLSGAFGILFGALGMNGGWPMARGGSQSIVDALIRRFESDGGEVVCNRPIHDMRWLSGFDAVIFDVMPRDLLRIAGSRITPHYAKPLSRWRHGIGVSKVDFLLDGPIPWSDPQVCRAGTVHIGGDLQELERAESDVHRGVMPSHPFVMVCQQHQVDPTRLEGESGNIVWTYAHVPYGYNGDVKNAIENQIERFAPGFKKQVVKTAAAKPQILSNMNPNLHGGDIAGGSLGGLQQVFRPRFGLHPYRCSRRGIYLCSSATPPGAGVHGMNGWNAAGQLLADFRAV